MKIGLKKNTLIALAIIVSIIASIFASLTLVSAVTDNTQKLQSWILTKDPLLSINNPAICDLNYVGSAFLSKLDINSKEVLEWVQK